MSNASTYILACEAVAVAAADVFGEAEAFAPRSFPAPLRASADRLEAAIAALAVTDVSWSDSFDRIRAARELGIAGLDLAGALMHLVCVSEDRNEVLARTMPSATRIQRALTEIASHKRVLAPTPVASMELAVAA